MQTVHSYQITRSESAPYSRTRTTCDTLSATNSSGIDGISAGIIGRLIREDHGREERR
jgi:hypothetical protein